MMDDGFFLRIQQLDAARGHWKREAVALARRCRAYEEDFRQLLVDYRAMVAERDHQTMLRRRAELDVDPMLEAEARALDEVLRLQRQLDELRQREVVHLVHVLDQVRRGR